jgi:hypothetical protein
MSAKKALTLTEAEVRVGRVQQAGRAGAAQARGGTLEEQLARTGAALRGKLRPDITGDAVRISPEDTQSLTNALDQYFRVGKNQPLSANNAKDALKNVLDGDYDKLVKSKLELLEEALGFDFHMALTQAMARDLSVSDEILFGALTIWNLPRRFMAGLFDWSFMLRQDLFAAITEPNAWRKTVTSYPRAFASADYAQAASREMMDAATSRTAREYGLAMPISGQATTGEELLLTGAEKGILAAQIRKFPLLGRMFDATDRSASVYISGSRKNIVEKWWTDMMPAKSRIRYLDAVDEEAKDVVLREWIGEGNEGTMRDLMAFRNETSGRGALGPFDRWSQPLNFIFFAPRFVAGQVTRLRFAVDPRISKPVRQLAQRKLLQFYGTFATMLGIISASGVAAVEWDMRSTDWGKVKVGNTRIDITGGQQPLFRYMAQIMSGQRKPEIGDIQDIDRKAAVLNFVRSKMAPSSGTIWSALEGETFIGEALGPEALMLNLFVPIFLQDVQEASLSKAGSPLSSLISLLSFVGVGVQTYETRTAAASQIIADMFEQGMIDPNQYDNLPETMGDLLPEDRKQFGELAPNLLQELEESTERTIERAGERTQQAFLGELGRVGREQAQSGIQTAANIFAQTRDGAEFRAGVDATIEQQRGLRAGLQTLRDELGLEARERAGPVFDDLEAYFDIFDRYPDASVDVVQRSDMFDEIERFFARISPAREAAVEAQLGLNLEGIPEYDQLKADRRTIREAGWFDLGQDVWDEMRRARSDLRLPETRREYEAALGQEARRRFPTNPLHQDAFEDADPTLDEYQKRKQDANQRFYAEHTSILILLDRWGYRDFAEGDIGRPGILQPQPSIPQADRPRLQPP